MDTRRRKAGFTSGFPITAVDEQAIAELPEHAWGPAFEQDGSPDPQAQVAELTGLWRREGWPQGLRYLVRRVKPSRRHAKKLTDYENRTRWRYQITVTNIADLGKEVPGSHHVFFLDALHRQHAVVEDRVRTEKATGLRNLPFKGHTRNQAWVLAANIASDLLAYIRLLGLTEENDLAKAEPEHLRAMLLHVPARLVAHARRRILKLESSWPWASGFQICRLCLTALPDPG